MKTQYVILALIGLLIIGIILVQWYAGSDSGSDSGSAATGGNSSNATPGVLSWLSAFSGNGQVGTIN